MYSQRHPAATSQLEMFLNPDQLNKQTIFRLTRTVRVLLIPQSLAYAKIATIPGQYGLMSSWLPNFLYLVMGTSKGKPSNWGRD